MEIEEQVPSCEVCKALARKDLKLKTALVWVTWGIEPKPYVVSRTEYENNDDMIYVCDAPAETEMKQAILAKNYKQYVWLKCSPIPTGYSYALEYEDAYSVLQIATGEAVTAPNALAVIFEAVIE